MCLHGGRHEISDSQAQAESLQGEVKALQQQHVEAVAALEQQHQKALLDNTEQQHQSLSRQMQHHAAARQDLQVRVQLGLQDCCSAHGLVLWCTLPFMSRCRGDLQLQQGVTCACDMHPYGKSVQLGLRPTQMFKVVLSNMPMQ